MPSPTTPQQTTITEEGQVFHDMATDASNPCLNCGACCSFFRISFYHAETDAHPLGFVPSHLTEKLNEHLVCMQGTWSASPRCVALTGTVGESIGCSIYANRPSVCREYAVWDENGVPNPKCQELRQKRGLPLIEPQVQTVKN